MQYQDQKYTAGYKCGYIDAANRLISRRIRKEKLEPLLYDCSRRIGEAVVLTALANGLRQQIATVRDGRPVVVNMDAVEGKNIFDYPTGRVLAAYADSNNFKALLDQYGYPGRYRDGISDSDGLNRALNRIRKDGFCIKQTRDSEVLGIAVPVLCKDLAVPLSLGVYMPCYRYGKDREREMLAQLRHFSEQIAAVFEM